MIVGDRPWFVTVVHISFAQAVVDVAGLRIGFDVELENADGFLELIGANELKKKMLIEVEGQPYNVLDVFFATPTARGASTMVRTRLKNLLNGSVQEKTFRTSEKFPEPDVEIAATGAKEVAEVVEADKTIGDRDATSELGMSSIP